MLLILTPVPSGARSQAGISGRVVLGCGRCVGSFEAASLNGRASYCGPRLGVRPQALNGSAFDIAAAAEYRRENPLSPRTAHPVVPGGCCEAA
ncbi:hypothetical protein NDU88_005118 [Pleurodeles waltl]|uniref:Uncharacterized protein n=1 Tax=Pleurodeles waltl TaxID=8319 RepID=A0AAV7TBN8_PLEWA|nr:hypothetical protein NDU88_005118 [Pleurodeles waltl]